MLDRIKNFVRDTQAQAGGRDLPGVMIVLVIAGVVGFVGIQVMSTVISTTSVDNDSALSGASESLEQAVNQVFGLVGVAFLVVILSVIIVYLYGLRQ